MFIDFFCLCPLSLTVKLNFNISKVAYLASANADHDSALLELNLGRGLGRDET